MSLVGFSEYFGQFSLYKNYQLQFQYISKQNSMQQKNTLKLKINKKY